MINGLEIRGVKSAYLVHKKVAKFAAISTNKGWHSLQRNLDT